MTLEGYAHIADIVASVAVVVSLLFVAIELRKSTREAHMANWGALVDRFNAVYQQTNDIQLAELIARGRRSYAELSDGEKISFGHYLEQMCIANEGNLIFSDDIVHDRNVNEAIFRKHMQYHLGFRGAREWFEEFESVRGFPPRLGDAIRKAIGEPDQIDR
jgi:hypothetical protein